MKIKPDEIMNRYVQNRYIYEEEYFKDYFHQRLEKFTLNDIQRVRNWFWGWFRYLAKYVPLEQGNNRKVLEIGCSVGGFASILKDHNFDVYASDLSSYVISFARKFWPGIKFYELDVQEGIPFDEQFDMIFSFEVLEHLENPQRALENMCKKLSERGVLICSTPPPYRRFLKTRGHINVKTSQEWREILEKVGFQKDMIKIKQVSFLPFFHRYSKKLSLALPLKINLPNVNSTYFLIAQKI